MSTQVVEPDPIDVFMFGDGSVVEVKQGKTKARQGVVIRECRHCGYSGRAEIGRQPRPSNRAAQFCPSCRGAA